MKSFSQFTLIGFVMIAGAFMVYMFPTVFPLEIVGYTPSVGDVVEMSGCGYNFCPPYTMRITGTYTHYTYDSHDNIIGSQIRITGVDLSSGSAIDDALTNVVSVVSYATSTATSATTVSQTVSSTTTLITTSVSVTESTSTTVLTTVSSGTTITSTSTGTVTLTSTTIGTITATSTTLGGSNNSQAVLASMLLGIVGVGFVYMGMKRKTGGF